MLAVVIKNRKGRKVLETAPVKDPIPRAREILVRIRACGVNRADVLQRKGFYPAPPGAPPDICGLEFAGTVRQLGPGATRWKPGDRVMGILSGGGYAERVATHEDLALPIPSGLSWIEAGAIPEVFLTAFDALNQLGVQAGETLLIHAAASGVGTAAIQLAREAGLKILGTTRTPDKRELIRNLGGNDLVVEASQLEAEISRHTRGEGVEAILDLVGGAYWPTNLRVLALRGRLILVGLLGGTEAPTDLSVILRRRLKITGTVLRSRPLEEKIDLTRRFEAEVLPLLANRRVRPIIDCSLPLERAEEAHQRMENNRNAGKIVLEVP